MECFMRCQPAAADAESERFYVMAMIELTIYGHTVDRWTREHYPEDWQHTRLVREHGSEWGCWHSVACAEGELGSNDIRALRPITYEQFTQAAEQDWPYVSDHTTLAPVVAVGGIDDQGRIVWDWTSLDSTLGAKHQG